MSGELEPEPKPKAKAKKPEQKLDDEPSIIDEVDDVVANKNPGLEPDVTVIAKTPKGPDDVVVDGWEEFNPTCSECESIITGKRADKCPVCGKIMHPYCYYQHYMRNHLPPPEPLEVNVKGSLRPDGTYGDYKGFIKQS